MISIEAISFAGLGVGAIGTLLYKLKAVKKIFTKIQNILKTALKISYEIEDFADTLEKALEDQTLTKDEIRVLRIKAYNLRNTLLEMQKELGI